MASLSLTLVTPGTCLAAARASDFCVAVGTLPLRVISPPFTLTPTFAVTTLLVIKAFFTLRISTSLPVDWGAGGVGCPAFVAAPGGAAAPGPGGPGAAPGGPLGVAVVVPVSLLGQPVRVVARAGIRNQ